MSIRIRVYPQNGAYGNMGMNGLGGYGRQGAVSAATYFNSRLQTQKQVSGLQLGYERALWNERIEKVRLEERLKNPYALAQGSPFGGMVSPFGGMASPYGGVASPYGGAISPYGGIASPYGYGAAQGYNPYASSMLGSSLLNSGAGFFGSLGLGGMF